MKLPLFLYMAALFGLPFSLLGTPPKTEKEALVEQLFEERDPVKFEAISKQAQEAGIAEQTLVETRFLYLIDEGDQKKLGNYSSVLDEFLPRFQIDNSLIFASPEDFWAIVEYTKALQSLEKKDEVLFKKHIQEAFWLSPKQASIFGGPIEKLRKENHLAGLTLDLSLPLASVMKPDKASSLKDHLGSAKAAVIHFWSPWSRESLVEMKDFTLAASALEKQGIAVLSILRSSSMENLVEAQNYLTQEAPKTNALWLLDSEKKGLSTTLRVQSFPTFSLIDASGKVYFNGHPSEKSFWEEAQKFAPQLERPRNPEETSAD